MRLKTDFVQMGNILQDLTGLEMYISMKAIKTNKKRFETGFQQPKTSLPKEPVLTSLLQN